MIFNGYENDIKKSFLNVLKKEPTTVEDFNLINVTLYLMLKSYYFEGNYEYTQLGYNKEGETFIAYIPNKKIEEQLLNAGESKTTLSQYMRKKGISNSRNTKNNDIEINDFNHFYSTGKSENIDNLTKLELKTIPEDVKNLIEDLKKNKFYSVLFEDLKIKQDILLKTKKDYNYTVVEQKDLDFFLKENFKSQSLDIDNIYKCLNNNYDLRFFTKEKSNEDNNFLVIAHNDYEINGICPVNKSEMFSKAIKNDNFFNITSVMVASNSRGNGIGVKLFRAVVKEAEKRDIYLIRTGASNQGRNFLKSNVDNEAKYSNVPIINSEHLPHLYNPIVDILKNSSTKENKKELISKLLFDVREFQENINIRKKNAKSIDEIYEAENEEESYLKSFSNKKNIKKNTLNL